MALVSIGKSGIIHFKDFPGDGGFGRFLEGEQGLSPSLFCGSGTSVFSSVGLKGFPNQDESLAALAFMNSCVMQYFVSLISPTVSVISGDIEKIPFYIPVGASLLAINDIADKATKISSYDWDLSERSWGFKYGALKNQVQHF